MVEEAVAWRALHGGESENPGESEAHAHKFPRTGQSHHLWQNPIRGRALGLERRGIGTKFCCKKHVWSVSVMDSVM